MNWDRKDTEEVIKGVVAGVLVNAAVMVLAKFTEVAFERFLGPSKKDEDKK